MPFCTRPVYSGVLLFSFPCFGYLYICFLSIKKKNMPIDFLFSKDKNIERYPDFKGTLFYLQVHPIMKGRRHVYWINGLFLLLLGPSEKE